MTEREIGRLEGRMLGVEEVVRRLEAKIDGVGAGVDELRLEKARREGSKAAVAIIATTAGAVVSLLVSVITGWLKGHT